MDTSTTSPATATFDEFVRAEGRRLQHALVAAHGLTIGGEAAQTALVYCWEHWSRVSVMDNPCGYLFRVGEKRRPAPVPVGPAGARRRRGGGPTRVRARSSSALSAS